LIRPRSGWYCGPPGRLCAREEASGARSHVLGSCPLQLPPQDFKPHSRLMGGALIPPPSTPSMHRTMRNSFGIIAWLCGLDSGLALFMVFQAIFTLHLGSADLLQKPSFAMPRHRMCPRRGSPWHPRRPRSSSSPSGSPTPGPCCVALVDTSWTQAWRSPLDLHSSSPPPSRHGRPRHNQKTTSPFLLREHSAILQDLVFELRDGVNDLQFRVQQMEGRLSILLQLLATPPPAAPEISSDAPKTSSDNASSYQQATTGKGQHFDGTTVSPEPMTALVRKETSAHSAGGNDVAVSAVVAEEKDASI
jgi:hypothetical protein